MIGACQIISDTIGGGGTVVINDKFDAKVGKIWMTSKQALNTKQVQVPV